MYIYNIIFMHMCLSSLVLLRSNEKIFRQYLQDGDNMNFWGGRITTGTNERFWSDVLWYKYGNILWNPRFYNHGKHSNYQYIYFHIDKYTTIDRHIKLDTIWWHSNAYLINIFMSLLIFTVLSFVTSLQIYGTFLLGKEKWCFCKVNYIVVLLKEWNREKKERKKKKKQEKHVKRKKGPSTALLLHI